MTVLLTSIRAAKKAIRAHWEFFFWERNLRDFWTDCEGTELVEGAD